MNRLKAAVLSVASVVTLGLVSLAPVAVLAAERAPDDGWRHARAGHADRPCTVRIAVSSFAHPNPNYPIIGQTIEHVAQSLVGEEVCVRYHSTPEELITEMRHRDIDFFISSSGLYRRVMTLGAKDLAVVAGAHVMDPNKAEGSVYVVRNDNNQIFTLKDAKNHVLASNFNSGFSGFLTALREVVPFAPTDPKAFFSEITFWGHEQLDILEAVLDGRADLGVLRTCMLEEYEARDPTLKGRFRILDEKHYEGFDCRVSTRLYPNWTFSVLPKASGEIARRVSAALLDMSPTEEGLYWSIGTDFSEVDRLMLDLHLGPYAILDDWSWKMLWERYKVLLTVLITLLGAMVMHAWRSDRLVKLRTAQLTLAHEKERQIIEETHAVEKRLAALQKTAAIGQMSGIVAHELRQPLAAVQAYAHGLERLSETRMPTQAMLTDALGRITREAARANAIVERVRHYAKSKDVRRHRIPAVSIYENAVRSFRLTEAAKAVLFEAKNVISPEAGIMVWADDLEVDLVLQNLLKNAVDAAKGTHEDVPKVSLEMKFEEGYVLFEVTDNGARLSDDAFAHLSMPLTSIKPEGLGLGLGIVRSIADAHGGQLRLVRTSGDGIIAKFTLPMDAGDRHEMPGNMSDEMPDRVNMPHQHHSHEETP